MFEYNIYYTQTHTHMFEYNIYIYIYYCYHIKSLYNIYQIISYYFISYQIKMI